jgi:hypothetical protein
VFYSIPVKYREVLTFVDWCTTSCEVDTYFADESMCLLADNIWNEVVNNSQITGGVENAIHLHADIPCTCGRGSDLPFEAVLQEYL